MAFNAPASLIPSPTAHCPLIAARSFCPIALALCLPLLSTGSRGLSNFSFSGRAPNPLPPTQSLITVTPAMTPAAPALHPQCPIISVRMANWSPIASPTATLRSTPRQMVASLFAMPKAPWKIDLAALHHPRYNQRRHCYTITTACTSNIKASRDTRLERLSCVVRVQNHHTPRFRTRSTWEKLCYTLVLQSCAFRSTVFYFQRS